MIEKEIVYKQNVVVLLYADSKNNALIEARKFFPALQKIDPTIESFEPQTMTPYPATAPKGKSLIKKAVAKTRQELREHLKIIQNYCLKKSLSKLSKEVWLDKENMFWSFLQSCFAVSDTHGRSNFLFAPNCQGIKTKKDLQIALKSHPPNKKVWVVQFCLRYYTE